MTITIFAWSLTDSLNRLLQAGGERLPSVLVAVGLIAAGWLAALLVKSWSRRLIRGFLDRFSQRPEVRGEMERTGMRRLVPDLMGHLLFWFVLLFFLAAAIETLGLPVITNLLSAVASYLPNVLGALAIVFLGLLAGVVARSGLSALLSKAEVPYASLVGQIVQVAIILVALITGIDQIGIESTFLILVVGIAVATLLGAAALAFGMGARTEVSNILASYYVQKVHRIGQKIRISGIEGRVVRITPTSVEIESDDGLVVIPAKRFSEETAVILES
jgi:small-conductance mechanosensitive channel